MTHGRLARLATAVPRVLAVASILVGVPVLAFWPVLTQTYGLGIYSDFLTHVRLAEDWRASGIINTPHFLYGLLTIAVREAIPGISFQTAALVVAQALHVVAACAAYAVLRRFRPPANVAADVGLAVLAVALLFTAPITVFTVPWHNLYYGYIYPANVLHNPTILVLKPLALASFAAVAGLLDQPGYPLGRLVGRATLAAFVTALATLAKPNYTIAMLPAVVLCLAWAPRRAGWWAGGLAALASFAPAVAILAWQFRLAFEPAATGGIRLAPLALLTDSLPMAAAKLLVSIAFPLAVLVALGREARRRTDLVLAWAGFAVGAFYYYGLLESGGRGAYGNFGWSPQIMLFILFIYSAGVLISRVPWSDEGAWYITPAVAACAGLLLLHIFCGVLYYMTYLGGEPYRWYGPRAPQPEGIRAPAVRPVPVHPP